MIPRIRYEFIFPDPRSANEDGIVAWGGDLSPNRLLLAYRSGIFPWYAKGDPILWWSPDPRLILELDDFKLRKSLQKRRKHFDVRIDADFSAVIHACATIPREGQRGSWLVSEMIEAYETLHVMGYAHSIEAYQEGRLVGGLYGVAVGKVFCGESMFAYVSDASKVAFAYLVEKLREWGFTFVDCQVPTEHLKSLGAQEVSREIFLAKLAHSTDAEVDIDAWR